MAGNLTKALSGLTVREIDGTPTVTDVTEIRVSNATLTDNGSGSVSVTTGGGGGGPVALDDLTDVAIASVADNDFLSYESGDSLWHNYDAATARTRMGLGTLATQSGTFSGTSSGTNTGDQAVPSTEDIEDIVGAMVAGNTETGISVTYDDAGGKLNFDAQTAGDARYAPIAKGVTNGDSHDHAGGDGAAITDANLSTSDITTNDVSTTKHGFAPKAPNDATKYLDGQGNYTVPPGTGAPTTADYWVETANGSLSAEVVVGTTGITTTTVASRQAAAKAGRVFLPSNGFYVYRDTGSAWAPWGPLHAFTEPVDGNFAWINQGTASVSTTNGGIYLAVPTSAGSNIRVRKYTAPATPYTITAYIIPHLSVVAGCHAGLIFRQSSDGKLITFSVLFNTHTEFRVRKYTNATTFSADYSGAVAIAQPYPFWLRIADNGTNRICSYSRDGINFRDFHTVGRTDFLTADEVGFFADAANTGDVGATVLSWVQA